MLAFKNFEGSPETDMLRPLTAEKDRHPHFFVWIAYQLPERGS
jgi:hypothetical protein